MDAAAEDIVAGAGAAVQDAQPPPKRSSSPDEETDCRFFKFIVLITEDPFDAKRLLEKFAQFLDGRESVGIHLREARCGFCRCLVEIMFDGQGQMFLHTGCERFARAHNMEVGCLLNFKYEGDSELSVKVFRQHMLPQAVPW
jgi:hypothetical protein